MFRFSSHFNFSVFVMKWNKKCLVQNATVSMGVLSFADKVNHNESTWREIESSEDRKSLSQQWIMELLGTVETWSQSLEDGEFKAHGQCAADKWPCLSV